MPARGSTFWLRSAPSETPIAEGFVAFAPKLWKGDGSSRPLILGHGGGALYTYYLPGQPGGGGPREIPTLMIAPDMGGAWAWGNDAAIAAMTNTLNWATTKFGAKSDKVILNGGSMGGLVVCNWARQNKTKVAGIILTNGAVDLADLHDQNRGGYAASIETAYGGAAGYTAALPTHSPVQFAAELAGLPIRSYYSTNDTLVVPSTSIAFAAGSGAELISVGAANHGLAAPYSTRAFDDWVAALV